MTDDKNNRALEIKGLQTYFYTSLGEIKAVEYILPLTKGLNTPEIKKASLDAIRILQRNIPKNLKGELSVSTEIEKGGQLSVNDNKDIGNLSNHNREKNLEW